MVWMRFVLFQALKFIADDLRVCLGVLNENQRGTHPLFGPSIHIHVKS